MFGDQEPVKKKKEVSDYKIEISKSKSILIKYCSKVNPNAIKALKEKERKKREGSQDRTEQKTKKTKSREQKGNGILFNLSKTRIIIQILSFI